MPIELSTQLIHASIASVLSQIDPNAEIFDNPTQQGTPYPAWYIVHRSPVERQRECGNRYVLVYQIDIWYMLQQNITRMFDQYTVIAETLQESIEYLPIYGYEGVLVHAYENSWSLEMNAMKYSITLRLRCSRGTTPEPKMQVIEDLQVFLKSLGKLKRIRYVCTQFTDFDMGIETSQYCHVGDSVVLPFVGGIYRDGDNTRWEPLSWNVGPFGGQYGPITDDVTIDLVMGVVVGFDVCIGGTVGVGSNLGSDIVWRLTDMSRDAWHYVGPELVLGDVIVIGGDDLSRDAYEYVGPQKNLGPSPVLGGMVEPYSQGGTDTVTGTISSLALPTAHSGSYTGVSFDSLRYHAKGTVSDVSATTRAYGIAAVWYIGTITWYDPSLGDLSDKIRWRRPDNIGLAKQDVIRIWVITSDHISGHGVYDTLMDQSVNRQVASYSYTNGMHSMRLYMGDLISNPFDSALAGRIMIRYLDGITTFNNLDAFDLVDVSSGTLSKTTTTDRYDMYNAWGGELTLKADYE